MAVVREAWREQHVAGRLAGRGVLEPEGSLRVAGR